MSDPITPAQTETVTPGIPVDDWNTGVAGKKLLWMISCWESASQIGVHGAPAATAIIEKISARTAQAGITLHINQPVFEAALPVIIFAFLLVGLDYAKFKTKFKWL